MPHHLQRQIEQLKKALLSIGALTEEALHGAITAVQNRDPDQAQAVIDGDARIDQAEIDFEEECLHTLALHQPVAFDLRFVVAVLKINNDLERIADLAVNIAEQATFLSSESRVEEVPFDLPGMSRKVELMLRKSLDAVVNVDAEQAEEIRRLDDEIDAIHRGMYEKVTELIRQHPDEVEQMIHMLSLSRQLERIADHAVNIAEDVLYMAKGQIFRHAGLHGRQQEEAASGE
ncbi:MAG: phosphate signaling complex protein PhoU [Phycisphaeraceae bacterium]